MPLQKTPNKKIREQARCKTKEETNERENKVEGQQGMETEHEKKTNLAIFSLIFVRVVRITRRFDKPAIVGADGDLKGEVKSEKTTLCSNEKIGTFVFFADFRRSMKGMDTSLERTFVFCRILVLFMTLVAWA
jgi:hypothetical protein